MMDKIIEGNCVHGKDMQETCWDCYAEAHSIPRFDENLHEVLDKEVDVALGEIVFIRVKETDETLRLIPQSTVDEDPANLFIFCGEPHTAYVLPHQADETRTAVLQHLKYLCDELQIETDEDDSVGVLTLRIKNEVMALKGDKNKRIELPEFGIVIEINSKGGGVLVASGLKESPATPDSRDYNSAMDGIEGLVLALACAGFDIATPQFREALLTAVEGADNNL